jgi:regulatory protein
MIIAAVRRQRGGRRVELLFDVDVTLTVGAALAEERGLTAGLALTQQQLAELQEEDERRTAFQAAMRLLAYRPRSEHELTSRLRAKSLTRQAIDHALNRLRDLGYVNDDAFARSYADTQQNARPRAGWVLARELRAKGVAPDMASVAVESFEDEDLAYQAATRRSRQLQDLDKQTYRERLGAILTRRGFSYDVAGKTIERCWAEDQAERDSRG